MTRLELSNSLVHIFMVEIITFRRGLHLSLSNIYPPFPSRSQKPSNLIQLLCLIQMNPDSLAMTPRRKDLQTRHSSRKIGSHLFVIKARTGLKGR